jgi:hypothetical protein
MGKHCLGGGTLGVENDMETEFLFSGCEIN